MLTRCNKMKQKQTINTQVTIKSRVQNQTGTDSIRHYISQVNDVRRSFVGGLTCSARMECLSSNILWAYIHAALLQLYITTAFFNRVNGRYVWATNTTLYDR